MSSFKRILGELGLTVLAASLFYFLMLLLGSGENPRLGETTTGPEFAILGTFILACVASANKLRGKWHWTVPEGLVFLLVGAFAVWGFCGGFDHEGYYSSFKGTWTDFGYATAMIVGPALAGLMVGGIHYTLCYKKART